MCGCVGNYIPGLDFGLILCISCAPTAASQVKGQSQAGNSAGEDCPALEIADPQGPALWRGGHMLCVRIGFADLTRRMLLIRAIWLAWLVGS